MNGFRAGRARRFEGAGSGWGQGAANGIVEESDSRRLVAASTSGFCRISRNYSIFRDSSVGFEVDGIARNSHDWPMGMVLQMQVAIKEI